MQVNEETVRKLKEWAKDWNSKMYHHTGEAAIKAADWIKSLNKDFPELMQIYERGEGYEKTDKIQFGAALAAYFEHLSPEIPPAPAIPEGPQIEQSSQAQTYILEMLEEKALADGEDEIFEELLEVLMIKEGDDQWIDLYIQDFMPDDEYPISVAKLFKNMEATNSPLSLGMIGHILETTIVNPKMFQAKPGARLHKILPA